MLLLLFSCTPDPKSTLQPPDLPISSCGGSSYAWLPTEGMGTVVAAEAVSEWSLSRESIVALAGLVGLEDSSVIQYGARVFRVRYTTQDRGLPTEATMILALPDATGLQPPSLLYLHPTTGFEDFCAPSGRDITWAGIPLGLAGAGFAVAAPDYLGQNGFGAEASARHPFLAAEPTAVASLDSLRALWNYSEQTLGIRPDRATVLLGASQGGAAALWSSRYAAAYLPEAQMKASVMTVPPLDLVAMADLSSKQLSVASMGVPFALLSLEDWYGLSESTEAVLVPGILPRLETAMASECPKAEIPADIVSLDQIYTSAWQQGFTAETQEDWEPWRCMLEESSVGYQELLASSGVPTLLILGGADDITLVEAQRPAVSQLCAEGEQVLALECSGLGHSDTVRLTLDRQLSWISARLSGEALPELCQGVETQACD